MSFGNYVNMERLALNSIDFNLKYMTENNDWDENFIDIDKLENNMEKGFNILTQLVVFYESFLNSILLEHMGVGVKRATNYSNAKKLVEICKYYKLDINQLKLDEKNNREIMDTVSNIRNAMIHFKIRFIGDGTGLPDFEIKEVSVKAYFTDKQMEINKKAYIDFTNELAKRIGFKIYPSIQVFARDGRDGLVSYVYDPTKIEVDESRFV